MSPPSVEGIIAESSRTWRIKNGKALSVARKAKKRSIPRPLRIGIQRQRWQMLRKKSGLRRIADRRATTLRQKVVAMEDELASLRTQVYSLSCKVDDISTRLEATRASIADDNARIEALITQRIEERFSHLKSWVIEKLGVPPPPF
ncbi:hypothetical protein MLD38_020216 [Melastoma candidum]|uniref:Uncharacterized protein n=2 Tax=Melastoma candidum TaxID=119954 RepID=A0ACB9QE38_9MYRT|nr:hypothetical protein MLD38_020216 [Melastoma candidum]